MNCSQTQMDFNRPELHILGVAALQDHQDNRISRPDETHPGYRLKQSKLPMLLRKDTPVLETFRRFAQQSYLTVNKSISIDSAARIMTDLGVTMLTVTDNDGRALGILDSSDVMGEKPIKLVYDRGLRHTEIVAEDLMVPFADMHIMPLERVSKMSVAAVLSELNEQGRAFAIVVDKMDKAERQVEGVLSAASLVRRLDPTATWVPANRSFADIEAAIGH